MTPTGGAQPAPAPLGLPGRCTRAPSVTRSTVSAVGVMEAIWDGAWGA